MAGIVGILEGNAIPRHGVVVVDKTAEIDLSLAVADAVVAPADGRPSTRLIRAGTIAGIAASLV